MNLRSPAVLFSSRSRAPWWLCLAALASHALAQSTTVPGGASPAAGIADAGEEPLQLGEFVVTGSGRPVSKFDSAFSVASVGEMKIERLAPQSTVDLMRSLPGFWSEPSGGEGGNNVAVRGLPSSNFRFVGLFEDGLPNFQEQQESFLNADELMRVDATIESVEAVRGGTASIFSSNSPGANVNFITKKGTEVPEGVARFTVSDHGLLRWDGALSGPLGAGLTGSFGGFYRTDDGQRDPGFTANRGGQLRASITKKFSGGRVTAYVRRLDDRTAFYLPIPLADPRNPAVSLANLIDPHEGTLTSSDFRYARLRTLDGTAAGTTVEADLADGIYSRITSLGFIADAEIGDGWKLNNHFRHVSGDVRFNAMFSTTLPDDATAFLGQQLARAQSTWPDATSARYVLANSRTAGGARIGFDPATTGGLVVRGGWWNQETEISNVFNDLRVNRTFSGLGEHEVTAGLYFSDYTFRQVRYQNTNLLEVRNQPRALDIEVLNAAGQVVGGVTENGFLQYGTAADVGGYTEGRIWAPYVAETWNVTAELTLDAGLRFHRQTDRGYARLRSVQNLGNPATLADDNVGGPSGAIENRAMSYEEQSWTLGAHYKFTPRLATFARYTSSFRTPSLANIYARQTVLVTEIEEAEVGVRYGTRTFSLAGTVFGSRFSPLTETASVPDASGVFLNIPFVSKTETIGTEVEATWAPAAWFELNANTTLQRPEYTETIDARSNSAVAGVAGNQVRRIPEILVNLQPRVFFPTWGQRSEVYVSVYYAGKRFVDSANVTALPAYTTVDAGVTLRFNERLSMQLIASNLNNSEGLTEGNSRFDSLSGQGTREAIYGRPIFGRSFRSVLAYRF